MSHDELLPESDTLPTVAEATETAPETSLPDAPPAAPRRRRAAVAGADAASKPDTKPTPKPASRRKKVPPAAEPEPEPSAAELALSAAPPPETAEIVPPPPVRRRMTRRKGDTPAPDLASTSAPSEPLAEPLPEAIQATSESPAPVADAIVPPAAVPEKPTRRRSPRRPKAAEAEVSVTETLAQSFPPDIDVEIVPMPILALAPLNTDATAEITPPAPAESGTENDRSRRRRRPRRRADEAAEPPGIPTQTTDTIAPPENTTETIAPDTEADDALNPRSRRRRSGRTRREKTDAVAPSVISPALRLNPALIEAALPPPVIEREPPIDTTVGAHLLRRNSLPEITIDTVVYPPVLFFGNMEEEGARQKIVSEARRAAASGVHLHSVLVELPCPLTESSDALDKFDLRVRALLDADPDGFVMPRLVLIPAKGWKREYPNDIASYADGTASDPSLTSERFWAEAERSLVTLITHVREHLWGKRIFGYHLERGEWFQPQDSGYDRSIANRDAFRDWLREKYGHDLVRLRAAWYDGDVQFHTAEIPPLLTKPNPQRAFYETRRERRYIDFNEFTSESTARRLTGLAKAAKKAANHQALISVCYGYTFEFGHGYSGHLALDQLLASPYIDLLCGPPSYRDRKPGGAASLPAPVESCLLHGKLWLSEDDTKTYLAPAEQDPDDFNPRLGDKFATEQAQLRAIGRALTQNIGLGWMDLWGEGWLDDDSLWARIGAYTGQLQTARQQQDRLRVPEVVALIDEKSLLHIQRGEPFFRKIANGLRDTLQCAGVSYGTYLQSDILQDDFPLTAKLYLFLTPYRLTTAQRAAIQEKLQKDNKTLAFLFAPGSCEARPTLSGAMEEVAGGSVGLILRQQEWNSEIGSRVIEPKHPITETLSGREIGNRERINPSFYVDDPAATVLAEYQGSGLPSVAVRDFGKWKSVFVGEPTLPLEMLRGICRYAGVNVWTTGDDIFSAGNGWVMLHSTKDGQRTLRLPGSAALYDLTEKRLLAESVREHRFFLRSGVTNLFYVGDLRTMREMGLPNLPAPGTFPTRNVPLPEVRLSPLPVGIFPEPDTFVESAKTEAEAPASLRADLATLEAVLSLDVSELDLDLEEDGIGAPVPRPTIAPGILPLSIFGDAAETDANGKRRRRRGGRGRGRKRFGSISEAKEGEGGESGGDGTSSTGDDDGDD